MISRLAGPWLAASALALALLAAVACGGSNGDGSADGSGESGDPAAFAEFAHRVARAAEEGDVAFFTERVQGTPHTCTQEEVEASTGPEGPPNPICLEVGIQFQEVVIANYASQTAVQNAESLISDIEAFFKGVVPGEEDRYGPSSIRLYATAQAKRPDAQEANLQTAILTAVLDVEGRPRGRYVRGLDFEYVEGRWVIRGETTAGFPIAVELLEPTSAAVIYDGWTRYDGAS